jgi:hypothetical protein
MDGGRARERSVECGSREREVGVLGTLLGDPGKLARPLPFTLANETADPLFGRSETPQRRLAIHGTSKERAVIYGVHFEAVYCNHMATCLPTNKSRS